ncbi:DUF732 domain-containing protein [Nocardia sp. CDC153]|uniref:DUF732 domain-containing protein n=1 Tax=Nocardia sp. CDC153 TaxID=3112167 RepID=UPI002DB7EC20|nr:DUF732 domain-containing protein [Nocardia sp. CDC153]MEC3953345.1 DUF732 domain-containing protein [Nocardia sp. CDC153]
MVPTLTDIPGGPEAENLFIATLQRAGIRFSDRDKTIGMGRTVCASLQTNAVLGVAANTQSLDHISDRLTKGTEFSADQAGVIIGASIGAFCPEFSYLGN